MRSHDADHLCPPLVLPDVFEQGLFTRSERGGVGGSRHPAGGSCVERHRINRPGCGWEGGPGTSSGRPLLGHRRSVGQVRRWHRRSGRGRGQGVGPIAAVERHIRHLRRHGRDVGRAAGTGEIRQAATGIDIAIDEGEPSLFQLFVDRRQRCKQPLVLGRVGGVADADQCAVDREQAAAAATLHRLTGHLDVGRTEILVDGRDPAVVERGIGAAVAADGHHRLAGLGRAFHRADPDRVDLHVGEDAHERQVALQIPGDHLTGDAPGPAWGKQIDLNPARSFGIAKDVAAGQDQGLALPAVDHGARAPGDA